MRRRDHREGGILWATATAVGGGHFMECSNHRGEAFHGWPRAQGGGENVMGGRNHTEGGNFAVGRNHMLKLTQ